MNPTQRSGRISYLEFPTADAAHSARFYMNAFGWRPRGTNRSVPMLEDPSGQISICFASNRQPVNDAGVLLYVLVDNVAATCRAVEAHGAEIVQEIDFEARDITARFRDPDGNVIEIYQEASAKSRRNLMRGRVPSTSVNLAALMMLMLVLAGMLFTALWFYA